MRVLVTVTTAVLTVMITTTAQAFCGFYVAKADTNLFNQASQVVLVRDGNREAGDRPAAGQWGRGPDDVALA